VLGTHARSGLSHALLGSVAEWLARAAPCDVAVTRAERFTFEFP
jgi:nucleotide-binding universal stress UspA family protein